MSIASTCFYSKALSRPLNYCFILPDFAWANGPFSVLYLFHGLGGGHYDWTAWTNLNRYVWNLPLLVIMPDGGRGFFINTANGERFEDAIVQDLMKHVENCFNVLKGREHTAIGGLSMGGFGAINLGLKYPELFGSIGAHSSGIAVARKIRNESFAAEWERIFGPPGSSRDKNDPFVLAEKIHSQNMPALYFDCGIDDVLINDNRSFHTHLERLKLPHVYQEFPGAHTCDYWDAHINDSLAHHCRALSITPTETRKD